MMKVYCIHEPEGGDGVKDIKWFWRKLLQSLSDMSLLKKLTFAYALAVLIPTTAIGYYTYLQSQSYIRNEMIQSMRQNLLQIRYNIDRKMVIAGGMADNIACNGRIQDLLLYGMKLTPDALINFTNYVEGPIEYALNFNEASIYQIGVYSVNDTVPEYGHFFSEERINNLEWYKDFKKSKNDSIWLYPARSDRFEYNGISGNTNVFKLVKKIMTMDGRYLGAVTMDILEEEMLSSINFDISGQEIFAVNDRNQIIFPSKYTDTIQQLELFNKKIKQNSGYFIDNNILYNYEVIAPLHIKILSKIPVGEIVKKSSLPSRWMIFAVISGIIVLEVFTYFILKVIFSRLNQIAKIMNVVARGNFNIRIPINQRDEVGQLASDFNILIEKINVLINDVIKKETAQKDAQLAALQYQISPHFIYNTIDTFRMRMELDGNYEMADAIAHFGKMLRYNIGSSSKYSTVKEEIDYVEKYVALLKLRHGEKLKFAVDVPENLKSAKIIRFMLQPIVENSVKHGMEYGKHELRIQIDIKATDGCMEIYVTDNGKGIDTKELDKINYRLKYSDLTDRKYSDGGRIGLDNINSRIKLFYGDEYYIRMESQPGEYTRAVIRIPYVTD